MNFIHPDIMHQPEKQLLRKRATSPFLSSSCNDKYSINNESQETGLPLLNWDVREHSTEPVESPPQMQPTP